MPKLNDLGFGSFTHDKIQAFRSILQMHMAIARAVWFKYRDKNPQPYLYLDLTAGPGYANPRDPHRCPGSPLIFLDLATRPLPKGRSRQKTIAPIPFEAHFFEKDPSFAPQLAQRVQPFRQSHLAQTLRVHNADYTSSSNGVLPLLVSQGHQPYRLGLVYVDPSGNLPDFDILARLLRGLPRVEVLLHIAATVVKRRARAHDIAQRLMDLLRPIPKTQWLIRDTIPNDNYQWTFLMGTNAKSSNNDRLFRGLKRERFYPLDSKDGQRVLERLTYTKKELRYKNQLRLPFDSPEDPA